MRLFVAINLPEDVRTVIRELVKDLRVEDDSVRWTPTDNVHLTLKFLGEVAPSLADQVIGVIEETVPGHPAFGLKLSELGAFPNLRRPRVIWVGVEAGVAPTVLEAICRDLETRLVPLGFEKEGRRFRPHMTIGRVKGGRGRGRFRPVSMEDRFEGIEIRGMTFRVKSVELMESVLKPSGAEYHVKASVKLGLKPL